MNPYGFFQFYHKSFSQLLSYIYKNNAESIDEGLRGALFEDEYIKEYHRKLKNRNNPIIISTGYLLSIRNKQDFNHPDVYIICYDITNSLAILVNKSNIEFTFNGSLMSIEKDKFLPEYSKTVVKVSSKVKIVDGNGRSVEGCIEQLCRMSNSKIYFLLEDNQKFVDRIFEKQENETEWRNYNNLEILDPNNKQLLAKYPLNGQFNEIFEVDKGDFTLEDRTRVNIIYYLRGNKANERIDIQNGLFPIPNERIDFQNEWDDYEMPF
jgi:hypothetical protein